MVRHLTRRGKTYSIYPLSVRHFFMIIYCWDNSKREVKKATGILSSLVIEQLKDTELLIPCCINKLVRKTQKWSTILN